MKLIYKIFGVIVLRFMNYICTYIIHDNIICTYMYLYYYIYTRPNMYFFEYGLSIW